MIVMLIVGINIAGMIMRIISGIITSKVVPVVTHRLRGEDILLNAAAFP